MWIRSQDKKLLINADNVFITEIKGKYYIFKECEYDNYVLGIYSSEEKALEVLNQIQSAIAFERVNETKQYNRMNCISREKVEVYQMPKDDTGQDVIEQQNQYEYHLPLIGFISG